MLITTGKNPGKASRRIAKALLLAIPESRMENRGKRSLQTLIRKARKLCFTRICSIHKEEGKPCRLLFLSLEGEKSWEWMSPKIEITKISSSPSKFRPLQSCFLKISGPKAAVLRKLLLPRNSAYEKESEIVATSKNISISVQGKKLLSLGVSYEK